MDREGDVTLHIPFTLLDGPGHWSAHFIGQDHASDSVPIISLLIATVVSPLELALFFDTFKVYQADLVLIMRGLET